jgi:putative transposase
MSEIERKTIRLQKAYYSGFRSYFVTICGKDRKKLFVSSAIVECLLNVLRVQAERFRFDIYAYCFMPDHCHLLVRGKTPGANLSEIIRGFKGGSAKNLRQFSIFDAWQKGFYEHILRSDEDCGSATAYIFENPVRARLAKDIYEWPFTGSFVFDWRKFRPPDRKFVPPYRTEVDSKVHPGEKGKDR